MLRRAKGLKQLIAVAAFGAFSSMASAALVATIDGNDCSGVFGQGFANCAIPAQYDPNETPIIIKFDVGQSGFDDTPEINSALFPTIDGTEFSFSGTGGTGTWTYNPGEGDPLISFYVAKGGPNFSLFSNDGDANSGDWATPTNPNNNRPYGLSHLSFYDTDSGQGPGKVPEPTTMLLLGAGLLAVGFARRRARRD